jgi:O-antigen ligase
MISYFTRASIFSIIATCFCIPLSTAFTALFSGLTVFFWILSGRFLNFPKILRNYPAALVSLLLFFLFIIGLLYSPAELSDSLSNLKKYRELLFLPIVISLLDGRPGPRVNAINSFIAGCIVLMLVSFAMKLGIISSDRYGNSLVYHITHSFFMAVLAFWSAHRTADSKQYRYLWLVITMLALANIGYVAPGRIGMLVLVVLGLLFCIQRFSFRMQIAAILALTALCTALYFSSDNISSRINKAIAEVRAYEHEHGCSRTSMGMRLDWYIDCVSLIRKKPVLGYGTGGFTVAHDKLIKGTGVKRTDNPHNEYLFIAVQLGAIGLFLFLLLFSLSLLRSSKMTRPDGWLLQGVIVSMATGCLLNSFLYDSQQGHFFAFLAGILLASAHRHTLTFSKV